MSTENTADSVDPQGAAETANREAAQGADASAHATAPAATPVESQVAPLCVKAPRRYDRRRVHRRFPTRRGLCPRLLCSVPVVVGADRRTADDEGRGHLRVVTGDRGCLRAPPETGG